jgi:hypothetical protein
VRVQVSEDPVLNPTLYQIIACLELMSSKLTQPFVETLLVVTDKVGEDSVVL